MRPITFFLFTFLSCFGLSSYQAAPASAQQGSAARGQSPLTTAHLNVAAALEAEANGDLDARRKSLAQAIESGNSSLARWYTGQLSDGDNSWVTIGESMVQAQDSPSLREYCGLRSGSPDNVESHLGLANWCMGKAMTLQARAHLERIIDLDPDHALARNLLGYRRVGNGWISPREIADVAERTAWKQRSIQRYGKRIAKLVNRMNSPAASVRDRAIDELMELTDADAIGAVEAGLASPSAPPSMLAIDWMSRIDDVESSRVLARYSLMHPAESVRQSARGRLVDRPLFDFVPEMLGMLSSPVSMTIVPSFDQRGALVGYRQAFAREDFDGKEFVEIDRNFVRPATTLSPLATATTAAGGNSLQAAAFPGRIPSAPARMEQLNEQVVRRQAEREILERAELMQQQNRQIEQRNREIATVIAEVSGRPYTDDPTQMWEWWDQYNETEYQRYKPERYQRETITTSTPRIVVVPPVESMRSYECFVAGTPVVTCTGLKSIEEIVTGDLVLSRSIATGELSWKPVLRPTTRPASPTVNISMDGESVCCSSGHLFWVSGCGWKKASELNVGDVLHGARLPSRITAVAVDVPRETFNLEVADNANYFVSRKMVMTHDVTPRETNRQKVPGQALLALLKK